MKKVLIPLLLAVPAALYACGGESADDLINKSTALALTSDDADADANTEQALGANEMDMDEAATDQTDAMTGAAIVSAASASTDIGWANALVM